MFDVLQYKILCLFSEAGDARDREFKKGYFFRYFCGSDQLEIEVSADDFKNAPNPDTFWLLSGDLLTKSGRIQLNQKRVELIQDPESVWNDAFKVGGLVEGSALIKKVPYFNDSVRVPLIEVRSLGFQVRQTINPDLFDRLVGDQSYAIEGCLVNTLRTNTRGEDRYRVNEWSLQIERFRGKQKRTPEK